MTQPIEFITDALEYYDNNNDKYEELLKKVTYVELKKHTGEMNNDEMILYDKDKKVILTSRYELIGIYENLSKTWIWAWSMPSLPSKSTKLSKKILYYGTELGPEYTFLKAELVTSRFQITNEIQMDMHIAISSYLSKQPLIFKYYLYASNLSKETVVNVKSKNENTDEMFSINVMTLLDYPKL